MSEELRKTTMAFYEAFNRHDVGRMRELIADDFVDHEGWPDAPAQSDKDNVIAWAQMMWAGMPDLHLDVRDLVAEDDRVVVRVQIEGTHTGEMAGLPATGRALSFEAIDIIRLTDGRAVEHWGVTDRAAMYTQLGLAPADGVIETVQAVYAAFGRQDVPAILEMLHEDIAWEGDGPDLDVPWMRPGRGRDHVAAFFQTIGERLDIFRFEPRAMLASGNQVAAIIDIGVTDRATGHDLSDPSEVHLWTVEDGRVTAFRHYVDTHAHVLAAQATPA